MNIPKAIEILTYLSYDPKEVLDHDQSVAICLSIEALKWRQALEREDPEITLEPLPGETEQ